MQFDVILVIIKLLNSLMSEDVFTLILTVTNCAFVGPRSFQHVYFINCPCVAAS